MLVRESLFGKKQPKPERNILLRGGPSMVDLYRYSSRDKDVFTGKKTSSRIDEWLRKMGIRNYTLNKDNTINTTIDINFDEKELIEFPDYIQFNIVIGSFSCDFNDLISLRGCPKEVKVDFSCSFNNLRSLEGAPKKVNGVFNCYHNFKEFTKEDVKKVCNVKNIIV